MKKQKKKRDKKENKGQGDFHCTIFNKKDKIGVFLNVLNVFEKIQNWSNSDIL